MRSKVTIANVAEAVGVSTSTVSHAISGKRPISDEVKKRIFTAVEQMGYRPNYFAKSVKDQRTMLVGVLVDHCRNPITGELIEYIEANLNRHSYKIILGIAGYDVEKGRTLLQNFSSGMVDGIINMMPQIDNHEAEDLACGVPTVTHTRDPRAPLVINYDAIEAEVMEYLFKMGHRKIGYIASIRRCILDREKLINRYRNLYKSHGLLFNEEYISIGNDDIASGCRLAPELLKQGVSAIFCANDQMAAGVYKYAYAHGITIPNELSVVGFDDSLVATVVLPLLTTVHLPLDEMAAYTVENFLRHLHGDNQVLAPKIIHPKMIIRDSVRKIKIK